MVDNPETLDEVELYRNPDTGKLVGRDPVSGDTFPVPFESLGVGSARIGEQGTIHRRDFVTESDITINVPEDYDTNQQAIEAATARFVDHQVLINLADEPDSDLYIPPHVSNKANNGSDSERPALRLDGDGDNPSNVRLNSVFVDSNNGAGLIIAGVELTGTNPVDNESASIGVYGCDHVLVGNCVFSATGRATIVSYNGSQVWHNLNDVQGSYDHGGVAKVNGMMHIQGMTGSTNSEIARVNKGFMSLHDVTASAGTARAIVPTNGMVVDNDRGTITTRGNSANPQISDYSDVTGSRALDGGPYQNTKSHAIELSATLASSGNSPNEIITALRVGSTTPLDASNRADRVYITSSNRVEANLSAVVPPAHYYEIVVFGNETLDQWNERPWANV